MRKVLLALVAAVAMTLCVTTVPAQAEVGWTHYGMKPTKVARKIHCVKPRHATGPIQIEHGEVRCNLGKSVVSVVTFKDAKQQRRWLRMLMSVAGGQYVAYARGIIVIDPPRRGSSGARAAAEILGCDLRVA